MVLFGQYFNNRYNNSTSVLNIIYFIIYLYSQLIKTIRALDSNINYIFRTNIIYNETFIYT